VPADEAAEADGKRVSWVELYFDLIFAFAVGQPTHVMADSPDWSGFGRAFGLFLPLWWTWVGFVVLYNRRQQDRNFQRLFVLAGTLPCAVAAVEVGSAAHGQVMAFAFALAAARLILALAFALTAGRARQVAAGYGLSTVVFVASAFVPSPWRYLLWGFTLIQEAGFLLIRSGQPPRARGERGQRRERRRAGGRPKRGRAESLRAMLQPPPDPAGRVDSGHLAERFGLMIIILLGEVVVAVGGSAAGVPVHHTAYWTGLLAGLVLAAALWWIYFTAAAPLSESVLRASGGNPALAYGLYAAGHLTPSFALLSVAAGVTLTIEGAASQPAAWFVTAGLAWYLLGSRVVVAGQQSGEGLLARLAIAALTICIALLEPLVSAPGVVLITAAWACAIAGYVTWRLPGRLRDITADPLSYFGPAASRSPAPARRRGPGDAPAPEDPAAEDPAAGDHAAHEPPAG
jgi:low temperature requirement protein LtrA